MPTGEDERRAPERPASSLSQPDVNNEPDAEGEDTSMTPDGEDAGLVAGAIGRQLKVTYGNLLKEPVPKKFLDLLDKLEARSGCEPQQSGEDEGCD